MPPPIRVTQSAVRLPLLATPLTLLAIAFGFSQAKPMVLDSTRKVFRNLVPREPVTLYKVIDPSTGTMSIQSSDNSINSPIELVATEEADRQAYRAKHGRLSESLVEDMKSMNPKSRKRVVVTLKPPVGIVYLDKFSHTIEELKQNSLAAADVKPPRSLEVVLSPYDLEDKAEISEFTAIVSAKSDALLAMSKDGEIADISEYFPAKIVSPIRPLLPTLTSLLFAQNQTDSYSTLARSAYSHTQDAIPSLANNVPGATFESGLTSSYLSCAGININSANWEPQTVPFTTPGGGSDPTNGRHSLATFQLMAFASPGAKYHHRRSWTYQTSTDQNFIINKGIRSVSMSTNTGGTEVANPNFPLSFDRNNMTIDDFAYRYPYPNFITPTDNNGYMYVPAWAGAYNQISVGNVRDSDFTHFTIPIDYCSHGSTQTKNPKPNYGGCIDGGSFPNCASDREMPYLVAPGWSPRGGVRVIPGTPNCEKYGIFLHNTCADLAVDWGTSFAAPVVNGMVLNLLGQVSFLVNYPEATRAILILTTRNVTGGNWKQNIDGLDGNGVIHGKDAISFAKKMITVSPNGTARTDGLWNGSLSQTDFGTTKNFNVKIPTVLPSGQHLRVVLTWSSSPDFIAQIDDLSDLDLFHSGSGTTSNSWNSNIEVLDIPVGNTPAGSVQVVSVSPLTWRRNANARSNIIYVAMAWSFVADQAR